MADITVDKDSVAIKCSESTFNCQICMERFDSPRMLQCQHTFCSECMISLIQKHCVNDEGTTINFSFPCPVCRRDCKIRRSKVDDVSEHLDCFPEHLLLKELLQEEVVDIKDKASDKSDKNAITEVIPESNVIPHFDHYAYEELRNRRIWLFAQPLCFRNTRNAGIPIIFNASTQRDSTYMMIFYKVNRMFNRLVEILMICRLFSIFMSPFILGLYVSSDISLFLNDISVILGSELRRNSFIGINSLRFLIETLVFTVPNLVTIVYMTQTSVLYILINMFLSYSLVWKYFEFHRNFLFNHCPTLCRIGLIIGMTENCYHIWYMYYLYTDHTLSWIWFLVKVLSWYVYIDLLVVFYLILCFIRECFSHRNFRRHQVVCYHMFYLEPIMVFPNKSRIKLKLNESNCMASQKKRRKKKKK